MTRDTQLVVALQSGILFGLIWGAFQLFPAISAKAKAWIWRLAFIKPLLGLLPLFAITLSVLPALEPTSPKPVAPNVRRAAPTPSPSASSMAIKPASDSAKAPVAVETASIDPFIALWIAGIALMLVHGLLGMRRSWQVASRAEIVRREDVLETLRELSERAAVGQSIRLLRSESIGSAVLLGGRRCTIVLPSAMVEREGIQDLRLILAHEIAHIARRDIAWLGLVYAVQVLFFFNPLVWLAARSARLDHESATDRLAAQLAGVGVRTYADMLLRATVVIRNPVAPGSLSVAESFRRIHLRLQAMKHFDTKPTWAGKALTATLTLTTLAMLPSYSLVASPGAQAKQTSPPMAVLSPGQRIPELRLGKWIQGTPITRFEKGKYYVIDLLDDINLHFLSNFGMRTKGGNTVFIRNGKTTTTVTSKGIDNVEFVGIVIGNPGEDVAKKGKVIVGKTRDKLANHHIALDDDQGTAADWLNFWVDGRKANMQAPYTFIVDGTGLVVWKGHPQEAEAAIKRVVSKEVDSGVISHEAAERQQALMELHEVGIGVSKILDLSKEGKQDEAFRLLADFEGRIKSEIAKDKLYGVKMQLLYKSDRATAEPELQGLATQTDGRSRQTMMDLMALQTTQRGDRAFGLHLCQLLRQAIPGTNDGFYLWKYLADISEQLGERTSVVLKDYRNARKVLANEPDYLNRIEMLKKLDEKIAKLERRIDN